MKRPFATLCIFLFLGMITAHFFKYPIQLHHLIGISIISLTVLLIFEKPGIFLLCFTMASLGAYLYNQSIMGDPLLATGQIQGQVHARILKEGTYKNGFVEYEVELLHLYLDQSNIAMEIHSNAQLKIYESSRGESDFIVNDRIEIREPKVRKLLESRQEDDLNSYEIFLKSKGMEYVLEASSEKIQRNPRKQNQWLDIRDGSYRTKVYIEDFLDSTLDFENSDVLKSIIFGNQGYLSKDRLDIFSKTGTAHIMAVSGLHVGLMVMITDQLFKAFGVGRNNRQYLNMGILILYSYMVYFPVSIIRAGMMYILSVVAYFLERRYDAINALFLIAFLLLLYEPMTIFSISFQLSFVATLSILVFNPILNKVLSKKIGFLGPLVSVTLAAQIGTLPIMAYHFQQISLISLATNLLIVPLLGPMLSIAFISIFLGMLSFSLGLLTNQITNQLLNYIHWICTKCAIIPYGSVDVKEIKIIYIVGYYLLIGAVYFYSKQKEECYVKKEGLIKEYEL